VRTALKRGLLWSGLYGPMWRIRGWLRRHDPATSLRNRRWRRSHAGHLPLPPPALVWEVVNHADIELFLAGGRERAGAIEQAFAAAGFDLAGARRVLDFGCGCGRVIRHWSDRTATEWYGSDLNERLVAWCRNHLTFGRFEVNGLTPPLRYDAAFFDAIYAISVLTHLDEDLQERWLGELRRILDPDGALLVTTHGDAWLDGLDDREQARYRGGSMVVRSSQALGSNLCESYHPPAYFRAVAGRFFGEVRHLPQGTPAQRAQDMWVLRRPLPPG
jgi:SAM-dependent methyltransferase